MLFGVLPKEISLIREVYTANKPNIFMGTLDGRQWRYKSMGKTLNYIHDPNKYLELQKQSQFNLSQWAKRKAPPPKIVEVIYKDWGVATLEATKKYGAPYSVLNMAHPKSPGGLALGGGGAQEENMWHRTTCAESFLDKIIYFDKASKTFLYNETARKLLEAQLKMTKTEVEIVQNRCKEIDSAEYKVFFSKEPRICFRGPEVGLVTSGFDGFSPNRIIADRKQSYSFLRPENIFPFYELRSAAPELDTESYDLDPKTIEEYTMDLRRRIEAQLDTLILENQPNVILGAWGCGAFKNDPKMVAKIYCEAIEKRASFFEHILFPIIKTDSHDNYAIFEQYLSGMTLGNAKSADAKLKFK